MHLLLTPDNHLPTTHSQLIERRFPRSWTPHFLTVLTVPHQRPFIPNQLITHTLRLHRHFLPLIIPNSKLLTFQVTAVATDFMEVTLSRKRAKKCQPRLSKDTKPSAPKLSTLRIPPSSTFHPHQRSPSHSRNSPLIPHSRASFVPIRLPLMTIYANCQDTNISKSAILLSDWDSGTVGQLFF